MELFIHNSNSNQLLSIDFDCLRTVTYLQTINAPIKVCFSRNPSNSPNGFLPYMKCDNNELIAGYDEIVEYFTSKGCVNIPLRAEYLSSSYQSQIFEQLIPYLKFTLWGDRSNADIVRALYASVLSFPCNLVYPQRYMKKSLEYLRTIADFPTEDKYVKHNAADLIRNAKKCINMLASRINAKHVFFGGKRPNEVDATIFSALSIFLKIDLPSNDIKSHILECPTLIEYVHRMHDLQSKFCMEPNEIGVKPCLSKHVLAREKSYMVSPYTIFGIATISSMGLFAFIHGLLHNDVEEYAENSNDE